MGARMGAWMVRPACNGIWKSVGRLMPASLFLVALSGPVEADDLGQTYPYRASAYAGVFIPQIESWSGSGAISGLPFTATGKLSSNTGWAIGALIGYSFEDVPDWQWLNIDLTAGYVSSSFSHFAGTLTLPGFGSVTSPVPLSGDFHTYAGFVNFLVTPFGNRALLGNKVTPFIGIGPGIANTTAKLQSFSLGGATLPVNDTSSETDFAFDATLGADYALSPQWDLGIAYQYTWIGTRHLGSGAGISANSGSSTGHSIGLVLEYRFGKAS
jgi:opacity protein-like surface antigen